MFRACPYCGKIHSTDKVCKPIRNYAGGNERVLRNKSVWHKKSIEIRERANNLCEVCKDQGVFTYNNLEVHHIIKLTERPDLLLDNENLIVLCQEHHKLADDGKIDNEYLKELAREREGSEYNPVGI